MVTANDAERIQPALAALLASDAPKLRAALEGDPELIRISMADDNTLLELATQPCVGDVSAEVIGVLIEHGAKLDRALNLAACWNRSGLVKQLLDAGADPTARADADITPLESAALHGSTEAADILVRHGVHRDGLWLAAAAGRLDLVRTWVDERGALLKPPGTYRPNFADVGRPQGAPPTDDPAEIVGEALVFAAANGRIEVVDYLRHAGVSIDVRPYRNTTGLHLAIQFRKVAMVRHLLECGAAITIKDDQYDSDAHGWAVACDKGSGASSQIRSLVAAAATS